MRTIACRCHITASGACNCRCAITVIGTGSVRQGFTVFACTQRTNSLSLAGSSTTRARFILFAYCITALIDFIMSTVIIRNIYCILISVIVGIKLTVKELTGITNRFGITISRSALVSADKGTFYNNLALNINSCHWIKIKCHALGNRYSCTLRNDKLNNHFELISILTVKVIFGIANKNSITQDSKDVSKWILGFIAIKNNCIKRAIVFNTFLRPNTKIKTRYWTICISIDSCSFINCELIIKIQCNNKIILLFDVINIHRYRIKNEVVSTISTVNIENATVNTVHHNLRILSRTTTAKNSIIIVSVYITCAVNYIFNILNIGIYSRCVTNISYVNCCIVKNDLSVVVLQFYKDISFSCLIAKSCWHITTFKIKALVCHVIKHIVNNTFKYENILTA